MKQTNDMAADVRQFMAAFGQAMPATPQWPDKETMDLRVRLVAEEFCEWLRDSGYDHSLWIGWMAGSKHDRHVFKSTACSEERSLPKSADALIDLLYVTIGSLLAMGIDMWPLWRAVQAANLAKAGGPVIDGKVRKPEGWQPPDIEGELRKQGWHGRGAMRKAEEAKRNWVVRMRCVVKKEVLLENCTRAQAEQDPWEHAVDEVEIEKVDWEVTRVEEDK